MKMCHAYEVESRCMLMNAWLVEKWGITVVLVGDSRSLRSEVVESFLRLYRRFSPSPRTPLRPQPFSLSLLVALSSPF